VAIEIRSLGLLDPHQGSLDIGVSRRQNNVRLAVKVGQTNCTSAAIEIDISPADALALSRWLANAAAYAQANRDECGITSTDTEDE
tara:strand:+ start:479 stop:736 length:258 start_codon:yes stop_codon:yes gene_type:complete